MSSLGRNVLSVSALSKSFGGVKVLHDVSFDLRAGEIHALVGENGSGKSTFIRCMAGYHQPSAGSNIVVDGEVVEHTLSPSASLARGFSFVHQNLGLVPTLSVRENMAIMRGYKQGRLWRINWRHTTQQANNAIALIGAQIDPGQIVKKLSQADRTLVAIARALQDFDSPRKILVLDEPTASLPEEEVARLFSVLRNIAARGIGIIYVSHRLSEIMKLCDRVTALRDGRSVGTKDVAELSEAKIIEMMIGRQLGGANPVAKHVPLTEVVLEAKGISGNRAKNISFSLRKGEILGIAGLLGSGRSEIGRLIFGAQSLTSGEILVDRRRVLLNGPREGLRAGIGYVSQDRLGQGGMPLMTLAENMTISRLSDFWRNGFLNKAKERASVLDLIRQYNVKPQAPNLAFKNFSGGNQQKAILARVLRRDPKIVVLDEPTQGIDVMSKSEIYQLIEKIAKAGSSVILIDADFKDLAELCHRVLIVSRGMVLQEVSGDALTQHNLTQIVFSE